MILTRKLTEWNSVNQLLSATHTPSHNSRPTSPKKLPSMAGWRRLNRAKMHEIKWLEHLKSGELLICTSTFTWKNMVKTWKPKKYKYDETVQNHRKLISWLIENQFIYSKSVQLDIQPEPPGHHGSWSSPYRLLTHTWRTLKVTDSRDKLHQCQGNKCRFKVGHFYRV